MQQLSNFVRNLPKFFVSLMLACNLWGVTPLNSAQEPIRKIVMISTQQCRGCKMMFALLQQVAAKSQGKIIIESKLYDQAQDFLAKHAIGHIDLVPYLCVLVDDHVIQTFPSSTGFKSAQQIWNALDKAALRL